MIKKSYRLIEFGNKEHNTLALFCIASFAFVITFLATFSFSCAKLSVKQVFSKNVKSSLRRVAWFTRNSYLNLRLIDDDNFDFTEDLEFEEVKIVEKFLENRKAKLKIENYLSEYLFVLSFKLHYHLEKNSLENAKPLIEDFKNISNLLLEYILDCKDSLPNITKTKKQKNLSSEENEDFLKQARDILQIFSIYMRKEKYPWYIISGTFLGLVRENGFLKHDIDIDIGINFEDIKDMKEFISDIEKIANTTIKNIIYMPKISVENGKIEFDNRLGIIKLIEQNGIQIDIFIHYMENDKRVHGSKIHMWANTPYTLKSATFEGIELFCPNNADVYLTENYGDWKTPVKEFSCSTGTPNLSVASNFYSISFFLRRLVFITQGKEEKMSYEKVLSMLENQKIIVNKKLNIPFIKGI